MPLETVKYISHNIHNSIQLLECFVINLIIIIEFYGNLWHDEYCKDRSQFCFSSVPILCVFTTPTARNSCLRRLVTYEIGWTYIDSSRWKAFRSGVLMSSNGIANAFPFDVNGFLILPSKDQVAFLRLLKYSFFRDAIVFDPALSSIRIRFLNSWPLFKYSNASLDALISPISTESHASATWSIGSPRTRYSLRHKSLPTWIPVILPAPIPQ